MVFKTFSQDQLNAARCNCDQGCVSSVGLSRDKSGLDGRHADPNPMYEDHQNGEKGSHGNNHDDAENVGDLPERFNLGIHVSLPALCGHA